LLFAHPSPSLHVAIVIALTVAVSATTTFMTVRQTSQRGLMQTNVDPDNPMAQSQKYMMYIVPFFSLTGLYWQYGLVLYWVTTNLWTLGQQFFMFRNWEVEPAGAAAATAAATSATGGTAVRATQSSLRPGSGGAKAAGRTGSASTRTGSASTRTGSASTRPASNTTQVKRDGSAGSRPAGGSNGSGAARAGSTSGGAAATSRGAATTAPAPATGQSGGEKRNLLRLGRPKQEPVPEPELPATKVVRQQPVRQAKSKRSGKR
ncbi:MAG: YidC/Oxa1 family membrane protein insertase, partial [Streptosporangiaceae bacterium]